MKFDLENFQKYSPILIESGSSSGAGIQRGIDAGFHWIFSVELSEKWYRHCLARFAEEWHVRLFYGNSVELLPYMLSGIHGASVIFLDAHPTGENSAGHDDLMKKGNESEFTQHKIITAELKAILQHRNDHIICIDDLNGDSPESEEYKKLLLEANPDYKFSWYDEQLNENAIFYKDKILVCTPD